MGSVKLATREFIVVIYLWMIRFTSAIDDIEIYEQWARIVALAHGIDATNSHLVLCRISNSQRNDFIDCVATIDF